MATAPNSNKTSPFDFVNAVTFTKKDLLAQNPALEKDYVPFVMNRALSYFPDTVMHGNEMNQHHLLSSKLQFDYLLNTLRPLRRISKWVKKVGGEDLEAVKHHYGYSNVRALQALSLLTPPQLEAIKAQQRQGGTKNES